MTIINGGEMRRAVTSLGEMRVLPHEEQVRLDGADTPHLSIVIPAYNEERRLPGSLDRLHHYLDTLDCEVEVIVVENGSTDATAAVVSQLQEHIPYLHLLRVSKPGKGCAVRSGILAARGDFVMFCDADFSMPVEGILRFLNLLESGADMVIASREVAGSQRYGEPAQRHLMGRIFNRLVQMTVVSGVDDTQCGFKAFQRKAAYDICSRQRLQGWAFDVEMLYLARRLGYQVHQLPIDWYYDNDSRVRRFADSFSMIGELLRLYLNRLSGAYLHAQPFPATIFDSSAASSDAYQPIERHLND